MSDNMKIWEQIARTDPKHTKDFTRAGGFKGTAIRPMYAIQKMTEVFGPCGTGWGYTKPDYTVQQGSDGQVLVYCEIGLWYGNRPEDHDFSRFVWGVGGDFVVVKRSSGLVNDDEAFKKAFTDALMNAMKHIGMSADIHMNQFDANKYIQEQKAAEKAKSLEGRMADDPDIQADLKANGYDSKAVYDTVMFELNACQDGDSLRKWVEVNKSTRRMAGLPKDLKDDVTNSYNKLKTYFMDKGE